MPLKEVISIEQNNNTVCEFCNKNWTAFGDIYEDDDYWTDYEEHKNNTTPYWPNPFCPDYNICAWVDTVTTESTKDDSNSFKKMVGKVVDAIKTRFGSMFKSNSINEYSSYDRVGQQAKISRFCRLCLYLQVNLVFSIIRF